MAVCKGGGKEDHGVKYKIKPMSAIRYFLKQKIGLIEVESELPFGGEFIAFVVGDEEIHTEPQDTEAQAIGRLVIDFEQYLV